MGKRTRVRKMYLQRDKHGRFKEWTNIGRSIHADARKHALHKPTKTGYGHTGDYDRGTPAARKTSNKLTNIPQMKITKIGKGKKLTKPKVIKV